MSVSVSVAVLHATPNVSCQMHCSYFSFSSFLLTLPQQRNDHIYLTRCFQMEKNLASSPLPDARTILCIYLRSEFKAFYFSFSPPQCVFMNELKRIYSFVFNNNEKSHLHFSLKKKWTIICLCEMWNVKRKSSYAWKGKTKMMWQQKKFPDSLSMWRFGRIQTKFAARKIITN